MRRLMDCIEAGLIGAVATAYAIRLLVREWRQQQHETASEVKFSEHV
jgi:hypothetical protein